MTCKSSRHFASALHLPTASNFRSMLNRCSSFKTSAFWNFMGWMHPRNSYQFSGESKESIEKERKRERKGEREREKRRKKKRERKKEREQKKKTSIQIGCNVRYLNVVMSVERLADRLLFTHWKIYNIFFYSLKFNNAFRSSLDVRPHCVRYNIQSVPRS